MDSRPRRRTAKAQLPTQLIPSTERSVCQGNKLTYDCQSSGNSILFRSPLFSDPFIVTSGQLFPACDAKRNIGISCAVFDGDDDSTFIATVTFRVNSSQPAGHYDFFCDSSNAQADRNTSSAAILVQDLPETVTPFITCTSGVFNASWDTSDNVDLYVVDVNGTILFTNQSSVVVNLQLQENQTSSVPATFMAINSCGRSELIDVTTSCSDAAGVGFTCDIHCMFIIVLAVLCGIQV